MDPREFSGKPDKMEGWGEGRGVTLDELVSHSGRTAAFIFGFCQRN